MARQIINTGTIANDGTGDTLRQAGNKINANFVELYNQIGGTSGSLRITDSGATFQGLTYNTKLGFIEGSSTVEIDLPSYTGNILVDSATQTVLNKTISVDSNNISGIAATSFVLSNGSGYIDGSAAQKAIPSGVVVGTTDTQTLTNKTLTAPSLTNPQIKGHILDSAEAELVHFTGTINAVNHIDITNAATGNNPTISVEGDTNVSLELSGAGTGGVIVDKLAYGNNTYTDNGTVSTSDTYVICNKGSTLALTLGDGTIPGEVKYFTNKGAGSAVITPTNFAQGSTTTLIQYGACHFIWDGTNWYLTGYSRDSDITIA